MIEKTLKIHTNHIKEGVFEVNGVIIYATTIIEAQRKYLRIKKCTV